VKPTSYPLSYLLIVLLNILSIGNAQICGVKGEAHTTDKAFLSLTRVSEPHFRSLGAPDLQGNSGGKKMLAIIYSRPWESAVYRLDLVHLVELLRPRRLVMAIFDTHPFDIFPSINLEMSLLEKLMTTEYGVSRSPQRSTAMQRQTPR
jgi:hypothetical protein